MLSTQRREDCSSQDVGGQKLSWEGWWEMFVKAKNGGEEGCMEESSK